MAEQGFKRKLTAILSADVIGYSRLMRDNEEATVRDIASHRVLISEIIQQHHGRVVDSPGDNILAEFASVVNAVNGAIKIQQEIRKRNAGTPEDRRMEFRIGVNLGDVIEEEELIYGDGVNITARVEELAAGGGIAISGIVYDSIRDKLSLGYHYLGEQEVKNIPEPVRIYRLLTDPEDAGRLIDAKKKTSKKGWLWIAAAAVVVAIVGLGIWQFYVRRPTVEPDPAEKMAFPLQNKPSIAVLPFDNMSDDPEQEYFSDGMTDELIGDLAKIKDILVISRNSAFTYKGKTVKAQQIAKELNVRYILEGSVQKSGDRVRIRAQLIDGETDHHLWAESYDGVLKDIFDLQDKITERIVSALAITLSSSERERVGDKGTNNIMAYEAFLKGREHFFNMTPKDLLKAIEYYQQAIKIDPNFSRAYAAIGVAYQIGSNLNWSIKMGGDPATHRLLARKYLELGIKNPTFEAYNLYAAKELHRRNFKEAEVFAQKAYEYAPNSSEGLRWLGWILAFTGRSKESIEHLHKAIRLDPFDKSANTPVSNIFIGVNHFSMGNLEEAITYLEKGLSLNPKLTNLSCFLAAAHALLGHDIEAQTALAEYLKEFPEGFTPTIQVLYSSWPFKNSKAFDRLAQGLVKAGLQGDPKNYYKVIEENKLDGQKIRKLLFGKTSTGYAFGLKGLEWVSCISDDGEEEFSSMGKTYTGRAWIENDNLCFQREQHHGGLKNCVEVYRNPDGDELAKTEYFRITDYGFFLFSVEK
jgi:adenylate cyclase